MSDLASRKAALRKEAAKTRAQLYSAQAERAANTYLRTALDAYAGRIIAGYMPFRSELSPLPALNAIAASQKIAMPVVSATNAPLSFRAWTPDCKMCEAAYGVLIPQEGRALTPEVLVVPMLAFDERGFRLGYGGGYYDRTIAALAPVTIGFAFEGQKVPSLPTDAFDRRLDHIVTEHGLVSL